MSGLPVTIRLLDPPLHEFLPVEHFEQEQPESAQLVRELQEANPMLGTRGVRLAVLYPPIYEMQVRAIVEAAAAVAAAGEQPEVEIMLPLIAYETELEQVRERIVRAADEALEGAGREVPLPDRDDAGAAAGLPGRRPHRPARRLPQLRHQRPDPDRDRALARRRRGEVPGRAMSRRGSSTAARSRRSTSRGWGSWWRWGPSAGPRGRSRS